MTEVQKAVPKWILIVSGLFAIMEIGVSIALFLSPQSVVDTVDLDAKGVDYLFYMWATRQLALGVIFGYATFKKSAPMLTLAYLFFFVMFAGDFVIGVLQKENALIIGGLVMCLISSVLLIVLNKSR